MSERKNMSRRLFLGTGMAATSAMLMAAQRAKAADAAGGTAEAKPDDIRCGFIGIGGRGSGVLAAINKSPGVRVTALCDIKPARLKAAAEAVAADKPELFEDWKKLLDYKELDAVFCATPCYLHAEMGMGILKSGRHCYLEKPMAISVADLNAIYAETKKAKGVFQIGTQLRYASPWRPAIEAASNGSLGRPILIRAHRHNAGNFPGNDWFSDPNKSGDVMLEQAVHEFDIFNAIFGNDVPERAACFGGLALRKAAPGTIMTDHFTLSLDYGKDRQVGYTHSWIGVHDVACDGMNEIVYCEKGVVDVHLGKIYYREKKGDKQSETVQDIPGDSTQLAVDDFFRCCREGGKPLANADTGRNAALTGLLCRKALGEGKVVTLKEILAEG